MITLEMPIYWQQSSRKTTLLSMNAYRNWHYRVSAKFKRDFTELVLGQLANVTAVPSPYEVSCLLYYKNVVCDPSNIIPLVEKVVLDALVEKGLLEGDNMKHHVKTSWRVVEQDRNNPRCIVGIRHYEPTT